VWRALLDENELRVLHERVARAHQPRLELLILQKAQELVKRVAEQRR
jgi:hypothetical protein